MKSPLGRERLTDATVGALQSDNPMEGLRDLQQMMTSYAAKERADWERQQVADLRAKTYEMADRYQARIQEGKAKSEDGRPWTEEELIQQFELETRGEIERLHSSVRSRAQSEAAYTGAILKAGLRAQLREYYAQQRVAALQHTSDVHLKAAIDAPDDITAAIIQDQAVADIEQSIELTPLQKGEQIAKFKEAAWGARLDKKMNDPDADIEGLGKWVDGLDVSADVRERFRYALETRGKEIGRGHTAAYIQAAEDRIVEAPPAAREGIIQESLERLEKSRALYKPEEFEEIKSRFNEGVRKNSLLYDLEKSDPAQVNPEGYGLRGEGLAWARGKVEDARFIEENQRRYRENQREAARNKKWDREFGSAWIELANQQREDPEGFDMQKVLTFQAAVEAAQADGYTGWETHWFRASGALEQWNKERELIAGAQRSWGHGVATQEQVEAYFDPYIEGEKKAGGEIDEIQAVVNYAKNMGGLPQKTIRWIESPALVPGAEGVDGQTIRDAAQVYRALGKEAPGVAAKINATARALYDSMDYQQDGTPIDTDEAIRAKIRNMNEPGKHEEKKQAWISQEKDIRKQVMKGLSGGVGLEKYLGTDRNLWPGIEVPGDAMDIAEVREAILEKAQQFYVISPTGRVEDALRNAAIDVFTKDRWGVFNGGDGAEWMKEAPIHYIPDSEWFTTKLNEQMEKLEQRIIPMKPMPGANIDGLGEIDAEWLRRAQFPRVRIRLEPYFVEDKMSYFVYSDREGEGSYDPVMDENNQPLMIPIEDWQEEYKSERESKTREKISAGKRAEEERMRAIEEMKIAPYMGGIAQ